MFFKREVGIDIVDVSRFKGFTKEDAFIQKTFTLYERDYCFLYTEPSTHLAGIFSAKEAVSKALGTVKFHVLMLEIRHDSTGKPEAYREGKKLSVSVSISHTDTTAVAVATA